MHDDHILYLLHYAALYFNLLCSLYLYYTMLCCILHLFRSGFTAYRASRFYKIAKGKSKESMRSFRGSPGATYGVGAFL